MLFFFLSFWFCKSSHDEDDVNEDQTKNEIEMTGESLSKKTVLN